MKRLIITMLAIPMLSACTQTFPASGMHTTAPDNLTVPESSEEKALVQNELQTQRGMRRAGHGFSYSTDEGRRRYNRWWWYY